MLRADYELGAGVLTNVFGWRGYDLSTRNDINSSPLTLFHSDTGTDQEQWSNETYYAADFGVLALTAGAYMFHQDIAYEEVRDLSGLGQATLSYGGGRQAHDVYGLYAQADYELAEALTLTTGLRWSREEKSADITYVRPRAACSVLDGSCPITGERIPGENNGFSDSRSWESLSPRVALAFKPGETSNLYASWTRGFRSGGYNLRITQPAAFEQVSAELGSPAFDEEKVDTFEIGAKWQSPDGLAQLNGALFWTEVGGLQREVNVPSLTSGLAQSVYNTADARIRGGEVEATFGPAAGFTLSANAGYTDAEYRSIFFDLNSDNVIDAADLGSRIAACAEMDLGRQRALRSFIGQSGNAGGKRLLPAPRGLCLYRQQLGLQFGVRPARRQSVAGAGGSRDHADPVRPQFARRSAVWRGHAIAFRRRSILEWRQRPVRSPSGCRDLLAGQQGARTGRGTGRGFLTPV